jgi:hypothetical protein
MGWDAGLNRKLAVPLALEKVWDGRGDRFERSRRLRESKGDPEDMRMLMKLADNRVRLERLMEDLEEDYEVDADEEFQNNLDYINASVQLGLLEITGELEEIRSSEEIFETATA